MSFGKDIASAFRLLSQELIEYFAPPDLSDYAYPKLAEMALEAEPQSEEKRLIIAAGLELCARDIENVITAQPPVAVDERKNIAKKIAEQIEDLKALANLPDDKHLMQLAYTEIYDLNIWKIQACGKSQTPRALHEVQEAMGCVGTNSCAEGLPLMERAQPTINMLIQRRIRLSAGYYPISY